MEKAATSLILGLCSLGAAIVTLSNKSLTLAFFTFAAFCFIVMFVQLAQISENSQIASEARRLLEENPTELFGGFLKFLK